MKTLHLALDWTPNINHLGFFVAQELGFYQELGLELLISDPRADDYRLTPAKKVETGQADLALCPTESLISYRTKSSPFPLVALAAILQEDLSAIAVLEKSGIKRPKELDGKRYGSYQARYEDGIVRAMIQNDGGSGDLNISYPEKLGIWDTLLKGQSDSTWIFLNWEGVEVQQSKLPMRYFKMADYGIPYSYSPIIAANGSKIDHQKELYRNFLEASKRGFLHALSSPKQSLTILRNKLPEKDQRIDLESCLALSAPAFGTSENWGQIDPVNLERFLDWLKAHDLEHQKLKAEDLIAKL
jgi:ABC-type nitrate/sulfonate/bicarbonate transport system substrate-binding protein